MARDAAPRNNRRSLRAFVAAAACLAALLLAPRADAYPSARLVYSRARGAESCPDEAALRRAVTDRIGYDPFFPVAPKTVLATIAPEGAHGFVARVALVDKDGTRHGDRRFEVSGGCGELLDVMALDIAIAIDPRSLMPAPKPPPAEAPPVPATPPPEAPAPRPEPTHPTEAPPIAVAPAPMPARPRVELAAGTVVSSGVAPALAFGGVLGAALRSSWWSVGVEGRLDARASTAATGGGSIGTRLVAAAVVPCVHDGALFLCGIAQFGSVEASSEGVVNARTEAFPWIAAGGRVGGVVALADRIALRIRCDVLGNLDRATIEFNSRQAWAAPALAGSLGFDVLARF